MKIVAHTLLIALFSIGTSAVAQQQPVVSITGKVYDKEAQRSIEKAQVIIKSTSGSVLSTQETDKEGIYTIAFQSTDLQWKSEAKASGYNAVEVTVNGVKKDKNDVRIDFGLLPTRNEKVADLPTVYFDFDSSYLTVEAKKQLQKVVAYLKANPTDKIRVNGHTDSRGGTNYNDWLSARRAERVMTWLVQQKGVSKEQLEIAHYGKTQLQNECATGVRCSSEQHLANRRCSFEIVK